MMRRRYPKFFIVLQVAVIVALVGLLYFPGLSGDYVFDDIVNIATNERLHISSLDYQQLVGAALSGDAGPLGRPISLATFALNYYFTGLAPFFFKLTNLVIHLMNVVLVWALAYLLLKKTSERGFIGGGRQLPVQGSLLVTLLWGIHPLNLTSVLYVVQRMTSLSAFFGFIALVLYLAVRLQRSDRRSREILFYVGGFFGVLIALALSTLSKESGLLFGVLIIWIEYSLFNFEYKGQPVIWGGRTLKLWSSLLIASALLIFSVTYLPGAIFGSAFAARDFTLQERLLTEARVLWYYLRLFIYPSASELALYHDDFEISKSFFDPPITIIAIAALVLTSLLLAKYRKKYPLLWFGWGWFLIAHSMESTIFPLELVHEHRNYFSTIGILLLFSSVFVKWNSRFKPVLITFVLAFAAISGLVTWQRSNQWSNLVDQALLEAANKPMSERANYQLGRIYLKLYENTSEDKYLDMAEKQFYRTMDTYRPANGAYFALLHIAYQKRSTPPPAIVQELKDRLKTMPYQNSNMAFVDAFVKCQFAGNCKLPDMDVVEIIVAGLENPTAAKNSRVELLKITAQYYINRFGDLKKGVEFLEDAIREKDGAPTRLMLAQAYRLAREPVKAEEQLDLAQGLDSARVYSALIKRERDIQKSLNSTDGGS